ncbi:MAG: hypothetical protein CMJ70_11275, partial [Planctomycetaceae bacterium]|nr:hypothetical protein [Planctomycetaceae bacterium]
MPRPLNLPDKFSRLFARRLRRRQRAGTSRAIELLEDRTLLSGVPAEWSDLKQDPAQALVSDCGDLEQSSPREAEVDLASVAIDELFSQSEHDLRSDVVVANHVSQPPSPTSETVESSHELTEPIDSSTHSDGAQTHSIVTNLHTGGGQADSTAKGQIGPDAPGQHLTETAELALLSADDPPDISGDTVDSIIALNNEKHATYDANRSLGVSDTESISNAVASSEESDGFTAATDHCEQNIAVTETHSGAAQISLTRPGHYVLHLSDDEIVLNDFEAPGNEVARLPAHNLAAVDIFGVDALDDTLTVVYPEFPSSISVGFHGGDAGFDSLVIENGRFATATYVATGPDSGVITLDHAEIRYTGLEPITDNSVIVDRIFDDTTGTGQQIRVIDTDPTDGFLTIDSNGTNGFESITFPSPAGSLTINAGSGDDTIIIESFDPTFVGTLAINGGDGNDQLTGPDTSNVWTISETNAGTLTTFGRDIAFSQIETVEGAESQDVFTILEDGGLTGEIEDLGGDSSIVLGDFISLAGPLDFTRRDVATIELDSGETINNVSLLTVGGEDLTAFVGQPGGDGFSIDMTRFGLALLSPLDVSDTRSWSALSGIGTVTFSAFDTANGFEVDAAGNAVSVDFNSTASDGTSVDFPSLDLDGDGADGSLTISTGGTTPVQLTYPSSEMTVSGQLSFSLGNLLAGSADFSFSRRKIDVDVDGDGSLTSLGVDIESADLQTFALSNPTLVATMPPEGPNSVNLSITAGSLALAVVTSGSRSYQALRTDGLTAAVTAGSLGFGASASLSDFNVQLNRATDNGDAIAALDWSLALDLDGNGVFADLVDPGQDLPTQTSLPILSKTTTRSFSGSVTNIALTAGPITISGSADFALSRWDVNLGTLDSTALVLNTGT